ncbi:MAG: SprT family zinc-dependent metalloprotease [Pseudomonadota bacterium]
MQYTLFELIENRMKQASKPLLRTRLSAQSDREELKLALEEKRERAATRYPFHEISPDLDIKISPRAKRMALRVDSKDRSVKLVIPKRASIKSAYEFALKNADWIKQSLAELPQPLAFENGAIIPVMGKDREIKITYDSSSKTTDIILKSNELLVITNKKNVSSRIKRYLQDLAKQEFTTLAREKALELNKTVKRVDIKDTASRWGSCSHDGRISFSWRLVFAPYEAIDYVIAHEVAHLQHMDHSRAFWSVCRDLSDSYTKGKKWMQQNGSELMRYG